MKLSKDTIRILVGLALLAGIAAIVYATGGFERTDRRASTQYSPTPSVLPNYGSAKLPIPPPGLLADTITLLPLKFSSPPVYSTSTLKLSGSIVYKYKDDIRSASLLMGEREVPIGIVSYREGWEADLTGIFIEGLNRFAVKVIFSDGSMRTWDHEIYLYGQKTNDSRATLTISWLEQPVRLYAYGVFPRQKANDAVKLYGDLSTDMYAIYKVGTVRGGQFDGQSLLHFSGGLCEGPGCTSNSYRILKNSATGEITFLYRHSDPFDPRESFLFDILLPHVFIPELQLPNEFSVKGITLKSFEQYFRGGDSWFFSKELAPIATHAQYGTVYTTVVRAGEEYRRAENAFYLRTPDSRIQAYRFEVPFMRDDRIPEIVWSDNSVNTSDYIYADQSGGCGPENIYAVRPEEEVKSGERLAVGGTTGTGDAIYLLKDGNDPELKALFDNRQSYRSSEEAAQSYESFLASRPLFYWKDPFGRWIRFARADVLPAVECGKPVIYLYPPKETDARVFVGLKGPMTASEPAHGSAGWSVVARPDGFVVNKSDGKTYPNLYWEGFGVNYEAPKQGFVVEGAKVDAWLSETLRKIGFTQRENAEFREFWTPRLPSSGLVFITFVPQFYFDRDAPLRITPKPDTVSRIFMEWKPLSAPLDVEPLVLPRIIRRGFTVVEWGGALH